jgi:hypothetical protein
MYRNMGDSAERLVREILNHVRVASPELRQRVRDKNLELATEASASRTNLTSIRAAFEALVENNLPFLKSCLTDVLDAIKEPAMKTMAHLVSDSITALLDNGITTIEPAHRDLLLSLLELMTLHGGSSGRFQLMIDAQFPHNKAGKMKWTTFRGLETIGPYTCDRDECATHCWTTATVTFMSGLSNGRWDVIEGATPGSRIRKMTQEEDPRRDHRGYVPVKSFDARWMSPLAVSSAVRKALAVDDVVVIAGSNSQRALPGDREHLEAIHGSWGPTMLWRGTSCNCYVSPNAELREDGDHACQFPPLAPGTPVAMADTINSQAINCTQEIITATLSIMASDCWQYLINDAFCAISQSVHWNESSPMFDSVDAREMERLAHIRFTSIGAVRHFRITPGGMGVTLANHDDGARIIAVGRPKNFATLQGRDLERLYTSMYKLIVDQSLEFEEYRLLLDMSVVLLKPGESMCVPYSDAHRSTFHCYAASLGQASFTAISLSPARRSPVPLSTPTSVWPSLVLCGGRRRTWNL